MNPQPPFDPLSDHSLPLDPSLDALMANTSSAWLAENSTIDSNALDDFHFYSSDAADSAWTQWMGSELTQARPLQSGQDLGVLQSSEPLDFPSTAMLTQTVTSYSPQQSLRNVSEWLDGAYRPPMPCSHCRKHRLQCLIIRTTPANPNPIAACSSCVALFRECSLCKGEKRLPSGFETPSPVVGHLHGVPEGADDGVNGAELSLEKQGGNKGRKSKQFVRKGARILREWFYQNQENPYPTEMQKAQLSRQTGFSSKRISTWFANARRRQKQKLQSTTLPSAALFRAGSPMVTSTLASMTPMERWQASPPEDEPVPESAIQDAIASAATQSDLETDMFQMDESILELFKFEDPSSHLSSSVSSLGSRASETSDSVSSAWSYQSSGEGGVSFPILSQRSCTRRRRGRQHAAAEKHLLYQCTFCTQSFNKRHDWERHEKSVHLPLHSWICTPDLSDLEQQFLDYQCSDCRFCHTSHPTRAHWEEHEFHVCAEKPVAERSFTRKDYLWQHLRKFHACSKLPVPDLNAWRDAGANVHSRCGFCACLLPTWTARMHHLAEHFKNGARMEQWDGDWGLDLSALTVLRNAILPSQRSVTNF